MAKKLKEHQQRKKSLIFASQEKNSKINLSSQLINEASPAIEEFKETKTDPLQDLIKSNIYGTKKNQISLSAFKNNLKRDESHGIFKKSEIFPIKRKLNNIAKTPSYDKSEYDKSENELELIQNFEYKLGNIKSGEESED